MSITAPTTDPNASVIAWPVPPYIDIIEKSRGARDLSAPCLIELGKGKRITANLLRFNLAGGEIEVQQTKSPTAVRVEFAGFRGLLLVKPVEFRHVTLHDDLIDIAFSGPEGIAKRQKCTVEFTDGERLVTEVVGVITHEAGLFLYMVQYGNQIIRGFYPADAIVGYQIGEKIGELLVEQKLVSADLLDEGLKRQSALRSQKLGDYLQQNHIVSQEQVEAALERQRRMPQVRLGDALVQEGAISQEQLQDALAMQSRDRKQQLGSILIDMGIVKKDVINRVLAQKLGIPFVNLTQFRFEPGLLKFVPANLIRQYNVMPLFRSEGRLAVAMENPLSGEIIHELSFATGMKIEPVMASPDELQLVIRRHYGEEEERGSLKALVHELNSNGLTDLPPEAEALSDSDNTLVRLVNKIIVDAYKSGASDIHIETGKGVKATKIRFRRDGIMVFYSDIPAAYRNPLISRIKIMASLDISERRHPQDGKIDFSAYGGLPIELRIATIPTMDGMEDVVMRILAQPTAMHPDQLDLSSSVLETLKGLALKPYGLILVCGPTGSGKTTTLHSLLSYINTPERKIWTVEDPVEITQEGLRQVQVQSKIGWTFPTVLRSFLRADPDVIMVGETRDAETAKTVIEASLTGHLVFSTLHTNSAVESIVRLLDLGMDPFNFSDALLGILGQRLVRRLCRACRKPYQAPESDLEMLALAYSTETGCEAQDVLGEWRSRLADEDGRITLYQACGCDQCSHSGYKGRIGLFELLINTPAIKRRIYGKASMPEIFSVAVAEGIKTIRQDGIEKILSGETDWKQIQMV